MRSRKARPAAPEGLRLRHRTGCPALDREECACRPGYEASVFSRAENRKIRKTFSNPAGALRWRRAMLRAADDGPLRSPSRTTLREAAALFMEGAEAGLIRNRSGDTYKPSALRGYDEALRLRILPALGHRRLSELERSDLQALVEQWQRDGLSASTVRNSVNPLKVIFRCADQLVDGVVPQNPTVGLRLPATRGRRDRVASIDEARQLLSALPTRDRALWGTALFAGLRRGELLALRWSDVDLTERTITVERSYDAKVGFVAPKSRAGLRRVPIVAELVELLDTHRQIRSWDDDALVFGRAPARPFSPSAIGRRARTCWLKAGLTPITLHECRHTCASYFIAAGVNAKALSTFMGHSSITITLDRYGHLFPGAETEAMTLVDRYLRSFKSKS